MKKGYRDTDKQKSCYLYKRMIILLGEEFAAFALTEPSSGSDAGSIKVTHSDRWVI